MALKHDHSYHSPFWHQVAAKQMNRKAGVIECAFAVCRAPWPAFIEHHLQMDRIAPGGPYTLDNCQLVCPACNNIKGNRTNREIVDADIRREQQQRAATLAQYRGV